MMNLTEKFYQYHNQNQTFNQAKKILVALSGGKDSVCLLLLLKETKKRFGIEIGACHINHMIRGKAALNDLEFCRALCEKENVPFYSRSFNVPEYCAEQRKGLEEGAREIRYRLLFEVAEQNGYHRIATAHTASDQAETVLFRILRGTGMEGAGGIPETRETILRPLLTFSADEIYKYLANRQETFTEDSTNYDTLYSRNRLRQNVIPELQKINPGAEEALCRFGNVAKQYTDLCRALCNYWEAKKGVSCESGSVPFSLLEELVNEEASFPLLYEIFSRMAKNGNVTIDFDHFQSLISSLKQPREGKIIEISKGYGFIKNGSSFLFSKYESKKERIEYQIECQFGENPIPPLDEFLLLSRGEAKDSVNINKKLLIIHLAFDKIEGSIFVRNFRDGDKIRMYNMQKSVKKLFCDAKIPLEMRKFIPMVCDEKEVIWLPFFGLCDKVRPEGSEKICTLSLKGEKLQEISWLSDRQKI